MGQEGPHRYDVAIVGASIAGCTAATLFARAGARVALVERHADPAAHKTACTHFIQSSAMPTLERLGLMEDLEAAGGVHTGSELWTRWGWIRPPADGPWGQSLNIRREKLDPILRRLAAGTEGVDLLAGHTVDDLLTEAGRVTGVRARARDGARTEIRARLTVGADGRSSRVGALAGLKESVRPHGRFGYWAYFEDVPVACAPRAQMWFLDPNVAYAFPTDDGLTLLGALLTKDHRPAFKEDVEGSFHRYMRALPDGPPLDRGRRVSKFLGKLEMPNTSRRPAGAGVALIGDAALASDPLWGVGCGWALQSAQWLADTTAGAVVDGQGLDRALGRYRRRHRSALLGYELMNCDYATGRPFNPLERLIFSAAAREPGFAGHMEGYGTRNMPVHRFIGPRALARAGWINARHRSASGRRAAGPARPRTPA